MTINTKLIADRLAASIERQGFQIAGINWEQCLQAFELAKVNSRPSAPQECIMAFSDTARAHANSLGIFVMDFDESGLVIRKGDS